KCESQAEILHRSGFIVSAISMNEPATAAAKSSFWGWFCFHGNGLPGKGSKQAEFGMNGGDRRHFTYGRQGARGLYAADRRRFGFCSSRSLAMRIKLLASTAAPTSISNLSRPLARHRFIPRPRNNTEIRPSMPTRNR